MQQSLESLLQQIHYYPEHFRDCHLREYLSPQQIGVLQKAKILVPSSDLQQIICPSCDNSHFVDVYFENKEYHCRCGKDATTNILTKSDIATWVFDVESFLFPIAEKFKLQGAIDRLIIPGLWSLGFFIKEGIRHYCYYYQGNAFPSAEKWIKEQHTQYRYIVFTNKQEVCQSSNVESKFLTIPITDFISLKGQRMHVNKQIFEQHRIHGFRAVIFNATSGELSIHGRVIAFVKPGTQKYYFVLALWNRFNEPLADEIIERYVLDESNGTNKSKTSEKFCNNLKNQVKSHSTEPDLIDQIFIATRDENNRLAYMMRNPV